MAYDDDYFGIDDSIFVEICRVYSVEDSFTALVQFLLALFALASLYLKRQQEYPRRNFKTWFLDVSKQGIGAVYAHVMNMAIAAVIARNVWGEVVLEDECAWYAINYLIDTTIGLVLTVYFLQLLDRIANDQNWSSLKNSGVYTGSNAMHHWWAQLIVWILLLTVVKIIIILFMWAISPWLAKWGVIFFGPLQSNIKFELLFVMIIFPGFLNVLYFWVIDSFLRATDHHEGVHEAHVEIVDVHNEKQSKTESLIEENKETIC